MKIRITFDLDDEQRKIISSLCGGGFDKASYKDCKIFIETIVYETINEVESDIFEYESDKKEILKDIDDRFIIEWVK